MRIESFTIYLLKLPLKHEIKHASASRSDSLNLLVSCRLRDGTVGWGEGVPRPYVTGESPESAVARLSDPGWSESLTAECHDWTEVIRLCESIRLPGDGDDPRGCGNNAARCAVELAILDAYGQAFGQPISELLRSFPPASTVHQPTDTVRYSGAVTASSPGRERWSAVKMRVYGFRDCKVKVGIVADEAARMSTLRRWLGRRMVIRIDANEAWSPEQAVSQLRSLKPHRIAAVEQPVAHEQVAALRQVRRAIDIPVMLDESLTSRADAEAAIRDETCDLFNIRLSKCGGFLNSVRLAALAQAAGLGYQLGCHPGESGVLSAAGRHWACSIKDIRFLEGSYDRHLLTRRLTIEDPTFGYGGRAPSLRGPGLGVTVDPVALRELAEKRSECRLG